MYENGYCFKHCTFETVWAGVINIKAKRPSLLSSINTCFELTLLLFLLLVQQIAMSYYHVICMWSITHSICDYEYVTLLFKPIREEQVCLILFLLYGSVRSKAGTHYLARLGLGKPLLMGKGTFTMEYGVTHHLW